MNSLMHKITFLRIVFVLLALTTTPWAIADYQITNDSSAETAWVIYSTRRPANDDWPAGWRTMGWYKILPEDTLTLKVPANNKSVYLRVGFPSEIKPLDHATRERSLFWIHPSDAFTVVQTNSGDFLKSDHRVQSLEQVYLYEYRNGGAHTIPDAYQNLPDLPAQEIYNQSIHSVVWILAERGNGIGKGSGVLIDKDRKLVVTNQHVIDNAERVYVFFPYRDRNGILQKDLVFYQNNVEWLIEHKYATTGRVIAQNMRNDLAIVKLDWLPLTAREIQHDFIRNVEDSMKKGDKVHILGNPSGRLWNWTQGTFLGPKPVCPIEGGELVGCLEIEADIHGGNSGGPVLNGQGVLIGIITAATDEVYSIAATTRNIKALLDTVGPKHTFRIRNNAEFTLSYYIMWSGDLKWSKYSLDSGRFKFHSLSEEVRPTGYPIIAFDSIPNDNRYTWQIYRLDTLLRYFGDNYHVTPDDAKKYVFEFDWRNSKLDLYIDGDAASPMLSTGHGIHGTQEPPKETTLLPNYPNPFNPETWIPYQLSKAADVTVTIYASDGSVVQTLALGHQAAGMYKNRNQAAYWDGKNEMGESVASGVYFYTLIAGDFSATRKMLILK